MTWVRRITKISMECDGSHVVLPALAMAVKYQPEAPDAADIIKVIWQEADRQGWRSTSEKHYCPACVLSGVIPKGQ